jgi:hypothetical protein
VKNKYNLMIINCCLLSQYFIYADIAKSQNYIDKYVSVKDETPPTFLNKRNLGGSIVEKPLNKLDYSIKNKFNDSSHISNNLNSLNNTVNFPQKSKKKLIL